MPLDRSRIRAVFFDVDGTLNDTDDQWVDRLEKILHPIRFALPGRQTRLASRGILMALESPGNLLYHWLDHLGLDRMAGRTLQIFMRQPAKRTVETFRIIPGVIDMLQQLSRRLPLAVISSRDEFTTLAFLEAFELSPLFQAVATSQTCNLTKPFPDPVLWAAARLGVPPQQCLMVGDTTVDIHAGRSAGAQTLGVLCGFGTESELRRAGADEITASTADVLKLLEPITPYSIIPNRRSQGRPIFARKGQGIPARTTRKASP